ncbi:hypothetical protein [uncultured Treponema sp.]|uniref:hypothetical protein n=1 Tax=uncultured Treponema sp. TaxID=162155 RepID=UPI0025D30C11|nr:hypothetical protein [uncultured Treponema sp.]
MIDLIVYYLFSSSAVLFYGIGINKSISHKEIFSASSLTCFKSLFSASSTTAVSYLLMNWLLIPLQLTELAPFIATLVFILFSTLTEIFIGIGVKQSPVEFSIPLLSVILALNEGSSIGFAVVISCICIFSFYLMLIISHCVRERIYFYIGEEDLKMYCVLLVCLAVVVVAICGFNVSWFNLYLGGGAQ